MRRNLPSRCRHPASPTPSFGVADFILQGADVHLFLAEVALAQGDAEQASVHARQARALATCDGPPDYTYKVAYEEAGALLGELGGGTKALPTARDAETAEESQR